jgi:hypothetical protein
MRTATLIVAVLLPVISSGVYIYSIVMGNTRPQRMTRLLLLAITAISYGALVAHGDTSGVWLALVSFIQAGVIWLLALKYGIGGADKLDILCLVLCMVGVVYWVLSGQSLAGLVASIVADCIAVIPALRKTIRLPHTELTLFYALDALAAALVLAVGPYTWQASMFPGYLLVINMAFVFAIRKGRRHAAQESTGLRSEAAA